MKPEYVCEPVHGNPPAGTGARLEWLPSAEEWGDLRRIRNAFAHDYPETPDQRFEHLQAAIVSAHRALEILAGFEHRIHQRFPDITHQE